MKGQLLILKKYYNLVNNISKVYIFSVIVSSVLSSIIVAMNIIIPKYIINELLYEPKLRLIFQYVIILITSNFLAKCLKNKIENFISIKNIEIENEIKLQVGIKTMNFKFEKIENPEIIDLQKRAFEPIETQRVLLNINKNISLIISEIFLLLTTSFIIFSINYLLIALIILSTLTTMYIQNKEQKFSIDFFKSSIPINRVYSYYMFELQDFSYAKDIRLYNMQSIIKKRANEFNQKSMDLYLNLQKSIGKYRTIASIINRLQNSIVYGVTAFGVIKESLGIGDFSMVISAINSFSDSLKKFISSSVELNGMLLYLKTYFEFIDLSNDDEQSCKKISFNTEIKEIEFKNVFFKYPKSEEYILKNINIKIKFGESLSIVGENGAGKTTFIKLICGLYKPTKGEILVNGINLKNIDYSDYIKKLSVVFQDFKLFSFPIIENIILDDKSKCNYDLLNNSLEIANLRSTIDNLKNNFDTRLFKIFDKEGIELSGGQNQKIAIARAAYKNTSFIILDEPTASLDPISEYEIYKNINTLSKNKTTIFISHRMSSCLYSDKILVFDDGKIKESGTHESLIQLKSLYFNMFNKQAQYYSKI
ncbi:ABC transporter ATP-binding protein [Clostridium perfringens]|uniref:ABC transporter ATP-binding protein n=1 Tax=Clostridium perfringens TaxID=1502 RepID=UPI0018E42370|nr:ABC transporter ATP-binding protein [Clostridium perfringens]MBI5978596.1 ABC transporter ATP-binding protein [Clostridium perfringens]MBI5981516.1 ABC transporter ATP-binding protein [Clostridium perfringens]MBI5984285.1 ABC transporter ATP-binding protein [Clostridium perfringens]MBI5989997.1 ABC transporter ATP-binding protein [Clostridium perfringens]MBI5995904.1 ABC transporter ATP-binding protein [Clostridium perfringens]